MGKYELPKGEGVGVSSFVVYICALYIHVGLQEVDVLYIIKSRKLIPCVLISAMNLPNLLKKQTRKTTPHLLQKYVVQQM